MDADRFDSLVRGLQGASSRRGVLAGISVGTLASLLGWAETGANKKGSKRRKKDRQDRGQRVQAQNQPNRGNDECVRFCKALFPPGKERGKCISQAARGEGLCHECGRDEERACQIANGSYACCPAPGQCVDGACEDEPDLCDGVVCEALDQCHLAGECDPEIGQCSNPKAPDETACNDGDGNPCTIGACRDGECVGEPVPNCCLSADECPSPANSCRRATCVANVCGDEPKPDGTSCDDDDGNACTTGECHGGSCVGVQVPGCTPCTNAGDCPPAGPCRQAVCDGGVCGEEQIACPPEEVCLGGRCQNQFCAESGLVVDCNNNQFPICGRRDDLGLDRFCFGSPDGSRHCLSNGLLNPPSCDLLPECELNTHTCPDGFVCAVGHCCRNALGVRGTPRCFPRCHLPGSEA